MSQPNLQAELVEQKEKARQEFNQLRADDEVFAQEWANKDFDEWFSDVYLAS